MVRAVDPTSKILLKHYRDNYSNGSQRSLADLIMNIMYLRNTMSRDIVKSCEQGKMPWLKVEGGRLSESSKRDVDNLFLALGGKIFFTGSVNPMKDRSKAPRRGYGELVSEMVAFAGKAMDLASLWQGPTAVSDLAAAIRRISGFGGKGRQWHVCMNCTRFAPVPACIVPLRFDTSGFRMKEIILDLAEIAGGACIDDQLVDRS